MEGMRPGFPPRFEGPDFFNRMPFDEHHPRHRRHDDRRRFPRDDGVPGEIHVHEKPDRKSRWGSGSPSHAEEVKQPKEHDSPSNKPEKEPDNDSLQDKVAVKESMEELRPPGSSTPVEIAKEMEAPQAQEDVIKVGEAMTEAEEGTG